MAAESTADHTEVEWQFAAPDLKAVGDWLRQAGVPGYTVTPASAREQIDRYLDTGDWRLHRAGFTCRIRKKGERFELTLKGMAEARDGLRSRRELNEQLPHDGLAWIADAQGACGPIVRAAIGPHPLRDLFVIRTVRRTFRLADQAGVVGEIALDDTEVPVNGQRTVRLERVEVEVPAGAEPRARRFLDVLIAAHALTPAVTSKFEAAMEASGQEPPPPPDFGPATVHDTQTIGAAAYAVLRKQFTIFLAREQGTRIGEDIEELHQMRVAARRLRAAMSTFRDHLPLRFQRFREQFGVVAAALGEVRDLDVQLERVAGWQAQGEPAEAAALAAVADHLAAKRLAARRRMLAALDARRYELLVERFGAVLRQGPPAAFIPGREPLLAAAPRLILRRYRRFSRPGNAITPKSAPAEYHALRIEGKKLRYVLEFLGSVYGRPAEQFARRLAGLQELLGDHQDAEVASAMLTEMARSGGRRLSVETVLVIGGIVERNRILGQDLRNAFPRTYRGLRGAAWRRLRAEVERRQPPAPRQRRTPPRPTPPAPPRVAAASSA